VLATKHSSYLLETSKTYDATEWNRSEDFLPSFRCICTTNYLREHGSLSNSWPDAVVPDAVRSVLCGKSPGCLCMLAELHERRTVLHIQL